MAHSSKISLYCLEHALIIDSLAEVPLIDTNIFVPALCDIFTQLSSFSKDKNYFTAFHAVQAPSISVNDYFYR